MGHVDPKRGVPLCPVHVGRPVTLCVARHCGIGEATVALRRQRQIGCDIVGKPFETADIFSKQTEIVVAVSAAHHLDVAGIFVVCAVHEHDGAFFRSLPAAGDPFVPAGDKHDVRLGLMRSLPLFAEVPSFLPSVWGGIICAIMERASAIVLLAVHRGIAET